ncbi:conserved hypothetical protein [Nitrosococcus halophilus Nc 4]|uniref:Polyketide cyclase/dehydrase n=1 Tax=Nitrosococcus halophilus (strain Nc4) TaxID=472759 RepID=D5C2Y2_NITHN|nr:SRPBCC family protein [Nitrosococcus halophilus]ADE14874.1 conserved hypothetical protein [Nitrosococcus halophilus Nc 4]
MFNLGNMLNLGSTDPVIGKADTIIRCSSRELFKYIGEDLFQNYPKWSPEVKELAQLTSGPVKLGTVGRQVRVDQGRRSESKFKVSAFEPDVRLTFTGVSEPFRCTYELQEITPEESVKLTFSFELLELLAVMRPVEGLVRAAVKNGAVKTVQNIKQLIETDQVANTPSQ